ncbi:MAG: hypothetical protein IPM66_16485 [Acidobacteriota bacterium]|nr:MAG: hypothetical protein IPM66_16485 [Acidobacteriota bacterium]
MTTRDPFQWIDESRRKATFIVLTILTLSLSYALASTGRPLKTPAAPNGIISYEFAGNLANSAAMIDSWDEQARVAAGLNLGLDYLYLVAYPLTIGLGCLLVGRRFRTGSLFSRAGIVLAWVQPVAGLLDAVENAALIQLLTGSRLDYLPAIAYWCAAPKFAIVIVGLAYVLVGYPATSIIRKS